jgi:peptidyl-prolyl cis-trans isomerase C
MNKMYVCVAMLLIGGSALAATDIIIDKQGIGINKQEVDAFLKPAPPKIVLDLFKDKAKFEKKLQELYLTKALAEQAKQKPLTPDEQTALDEVLKLFYFNLRIEQLSSENLPDFESLAAVHYKAHKADYIEPERVAVEHILLDTRKKYKDKAALKLAKDIIAQLKKGADFATLALKYSDDPTVKENKGQLGFFSKGGMLQEFEDAAYRLKLQEVSEPVQTKYGYHVLRKYDQKASAVKEYAVVKDEIIAKLKKEYIQNRLTGYYEQVKTDNAMKLDGSALDVYIAEKTKQLTPAKKSPSAPAATK